LAWAGRDGKLGGKAVVKAGNGLQIDE